MNKYLKKIICAFIPSKKLRKKVRLKLDNINFIYIICKITYFYNNKKKFKNFLSIVVIAKNEGDYIEEWIEYHILLGVDHFYLYDNESEDNLQNILKPYINSGIVTYNYIKGKSKQIEAYNHAINNYKNNSKWFAFIDVDEFIFLESFNIKEFLLNNEKFLQIYIPWICYGDSGHKTKPAGLVIENFIYRDIKEAKMEKQGIYECWGKSIVNPRSIFNVGIHYCNCIRLGGGVKITDFKEIRINHYSIKSIEEFLNKKLKRGRGTNVDIPYTIENFYNVYNKNEVKDLSLEKIVDTINNNIRLKKINNE